MTEMSTQEIAKEINLYLAQGNGKAKSASKVKKAVKSADDYLLGADVPKPWWLDDFLKLNNDRMNETIVRAISEKGMGSLKGYGEGYFNEIIQNANDLHQGEELIVSLDKNEWGYKVECQYVDKGFKLSNIYAFLNREMSDKSAQEGQTGKYGVGIKSLLMFADRLEIKSNVHFGYEVDRKNSELKEATAEVASNAQGEGMTRLSFSFGKADDTGKINGFNVGKLSNLIDMLCDPNDQSVEALLKCFMTGKDEELVLDIRALLFLAGKNESNAGEEKKNLRSLKFRGQKHWIEFELEQQGEGYCIDQSIEEEDEEKIEENDIESTNIEENSKWIFQKSDIVVRTDQETEKIRYRYLCCSDKGYVFAFPLEDDLKANNRFYSTYFLKEDGNTGGPQMVPIGALIHSTFSNMHRTDLGDDDRSRNAACDKIKDKLKDLFSCFSSKAWENANCDLDLAVCVSDIFHSVLERYFDEKGFEEGGENPKHNENPLLIEDLTTRYLPKLQNGERKPFVVRYEKKEPFTQVSGKEKLENPEIKQELEAVYREDIERGEIYDYDVEISSEKAIPGVRRIYDRLVDLYNQSVCDSSKMTGKEKLRLRQILGFYPEIGAFIAFRITGRDAQATASDGGGEIICNIMVGDAEIDRWLLDTCKEKDEESRRKHERLLLKLVGRYKLSKAVGQDGEIDSKQLDFWDYVFNDTLDERGGPLSKRQTEQFREKYGELKNALLARRLTDGVNGSVNIRFIEPVSCSRRRWEGEYDVYALPRMCDDSIYDRPLPQVLFFLIQLAVRLLEKQETFLRYIYHRNKQFLCLFQDKEMRWWHREVPFKYFKVQEQQVIFIKVDSDFQFQNVRDFLQGIDILKQIRGINERIAEKIQLKCIQNRMSTQELVQDVLPEFFSKEDKEGKVIPGSRLRAFVDDKIKISDCVRIGSIVENLNNECGKDYVEFIQEISEYQYQVSLHKFNSNTRRNVVAYCHSDAIYLRDRADSKFEKIAQIDKGVTGKLYIFYDNYKEENKLQAISEILGNIGISGEYIELLEGYLPGNEFGRSVDYADFERQIHDRNGGDVDPSGQPENASVVPRWRKIAEMDFPDKDVPSNKVLYRLLTARGSYDGKCPICHYKNRLATEGGQAKDSRLVLIRNHKIPSADGKGGNKNPYIITVACKECFVKMKQSLQSAEFDPKKGELLLTMKLAHGQHESNTEQQKVILSPVNVAIIEKFRLK
ncbi:MAG: hypothetical protein IJ147_05350 [Lachnospiraceae bacterium]|nr:hypothetical protein [Lachnospiraceae bacterium]